MTCKSRRVISEGLRRPGCPSKANVLSLIRLHSSGDASWLNHLQSSNQLRPDPTLHYLSLLVRHKRSNKTPMLLSDNFTRPKGGKNGHSLLTPYFHSPSNTFHGFPRPLLKHATACDYLLRPITPIKIVTRRRKP